MFNCVLLWEEICLAAAASNHVQMQDCALFRTTHVVIAR
jgi:hypothetical protein